ncbi:MAG: spore cortex biosynthesis protein YabQ [Butyrivibrio sp.]
MADFISGELFKLAMSIGFGAAMAAIYDIFRILRRIVPHNTVAVSTEDLLFWVCLGFPAFGFVLFINDGIFRLYFVLGIMLGIFVYRETVSRILVKFIVFFVKKIIKIFTAVLKKIHKAFKIKSSTKESKKRR